METKGRRLLKYVAGALAMTVLLSGSYETTVMASSIGVIDTASGLENPTEANNGTNDAAEETIIPQAVELVAQQAAELVAKQAAQLVEKQAAQQEAAAKQAAELAAQQEAAARQAAELAAQQEAERQAAELAAQQEAERQAAELAAQQEAARQAAELAAQQEAARQAAEAAAQRDAQLAAVGMTQSDLDLMAAIIFCEAGGEPYIGKVAVANVVLNRMRHPKFPNTVHDVVYAPRQFSPVSNGSLARAIRNNRADASCYQAAMDAIGGNAPVGDKLFFRRVNGRKGQVIGHHVFY